MVGITPICGEAPSPKAAFVRIQIRGAEIHRFDTVRIGFNICYGWTCGKWVRDQERSLSAIGAPAFPASRGGPAASRPGAPSCAAPCRLLQHSGFTELTIEAIAADASVGKATLYRWWPNKGALVVDAFAASAEDELHFPDTGSVLERYERCRWGSGWTCCAAAADAWWRRWWPRGQSDAESAGGLSRALPVAAPAGGLPDTLRRGIERGELPRKV